MPLVVRVGGAYACALESGVVRCWGDDDYGQLGNNSSTDSPIPVLVQGLAPGVLDLATGYNDTCFVTAAGGVKCLGKNDWGQLGDGSTSASLSPVDVVGLSSGVESVTVGSYHACALTSGGGVKCWGRNVSGQLGNNSGTDSLVPVDVAGLSSGVASVVAAYGHTCALTVNGGVKCWGNNGYGELGNNSTTDSPVPVDVIGLSSGVVSLAVGDNFTCAVTSAGAARCWGEGTHGQMGNGGFANSLTPVAVSNLSSGVAAVALAAESACARMTAGAVRCWGRNENAQLGNGTMSSSAVPVPVSGLASGVVGLAAGGAEACALTSLGAVWCWGQNSSGQLGDNSKATTLVPVAVVGL